MERMFSLPFVFGGKEYHLLGRDVTVESEPQLRVTVMNGELEKVLIGKNTFRYNGTMIAEEPQWSEGTCGELRAVIRQALRRYLGERKLGATSIRPEIL